MASCASNGKAPASVANNSERELHAENFVMICGAISGCKCATARSNTEQLARLLNKSISAGPASNPENMRGMDVWIELDVISAAPPDVARIAQQIVHLVCVAFHLAELINRHIDIGMLFVMWIEIHDKENDVVPRGGHLSIKQDCFVFGGIESQVIVKLKRAVVFSDFV